MIKPRMRAVPFQMTRAEEVGDGLTLEGYAAVFNDTVRIYDMWDGEYDERFQRGAFSKSLREEDTPYLMFQHGRHSLIGSVPIGAIQSLREDSRGLHVVARLHDNWLVEPVRDAIASGSLRGMSIMFEPVKDTRDDSGDLPLVTRTEVKLLELGPVVFPAYDNTEVGVRAATCIEDLNDLRRVLKPTFPVVVDPGVSTSNSSNSITIAAGDLMSYRQMTSDEISRVLTKKDIDGDEPEDNPATPDEAAPEGTSDEAGTPDPERSVPPEVVALLARLAARRYPPQGEAA
jgi:HK97 family phage prohead protease